MSTSGHLKFQGTNRATFVGATSNIMFDTTTTSLGIGVTGTDHPSSNLYITGNAYVSSNIAVGGVLTMGTVNVVARHDLEAVTAMGNTTPLTIEFSNATTGIVTTGNVEVGKDLVVSGNVSDLNVVSNVNMLHTANTASIKLNSNVVTEFPRSKKLIKYPRVAMTSGQSGLNSGQGYTQDNYNIQVSTEWDSPSLTYAATYAVDNTFNNYGWLSGMNTYSSDGTAANATSPDTFQGINGSWINIQLPDKIVLDHFTITNRDSSALRNADSGILWAKNKTDSTWIRIHDFSDLNPASSVTNTIHTNQVVAYDEYRLQITKMEPYTVGTPGMAIAEWQLFGVPEYDPDADGVDVKVTSYPNVPNTDWLEVYYDAKGLTDISSGVSDLSGNSINGVVTGATLSTDENIDIFNFDGQNDIIQGTFSGHTLSSGYTMATWIKPGVIGADDYIATFGVGSNGTSFGINFQTAEGAFRAFIWGSTTPGIVAQTNNGVVTKDKWVHVAATFISGDGTIHLYIDNKLVATGTGTTLSSISSSAPLVLGARNSGGTIERHANFKMANFRLFNRTLTTDEIYQLYAYQKEYFGHGDLSMTLKAGRLGIGTSEPRAALDVKGGAFFNGLLSTGLPAIFGRVNNQNLVQQSTVDQNINDVLYTQGQNMKRTGGGLVFPVAGMYIIQLRTHCWYSGGAYAVRDEHQYNRFNSAGTLYSKQDRGTIYDVAMGGSGGNSDMHHASIVFIHANEGDYVILSHTTSPTTTRNYNNEWNYISAACICLDDSQFSS